MAIVTKDDIIAATAASCGITKIDASRAVNAVLDAIKKGLLEGNDVRLHGIGSLHTKYAAARMGRNPRTGEAVQIAARTEVKFSVATQLKAAIADTTPAEEAA